MEDKTKILIEPPKDKFYLNRGLFYSFGIVGLMASHFFVTATNYWMYKFRNPSSETWNDDHRNTLQTEFTSNCSIISAVANVVFMIGTVVLHTKISIAVRMWSSLIGMVIVLATTTVFVEVDTDSWQNAFLIVAFVLLFLFSGACAVFMVTTFQIGATFPSIYPAFLTTGQAISGVISALMQILSLSIGSAAQSGLVYFLCGLALVIQTVLLLSYTRRNSDFFNYYNSIKIEDSNDKLSKELVLNILKKFKYYIITVILISGSTVMVHPGVTSLVVSKSKGTEWNDTYFVPVVTFFLYNFADVIGRSIALKFMKPENPIVLIVLSALRCVLVPLLMFCNVQPRDYLPVAFNEDYLYIIFIIIFGASHGYLLNVSVINMSRLAEGAERVLTMFLLLTIILLSVAAFSFMSKVLVGAI